MTMPEKEPKAYLHIDTSGPHPVIAASPRHSRELKALFERHGIPCHCPTAWDWDRMILQLQAADLDRARAVLESYKTAKGS